MSKPNKLFIVLGDQLFPSSHRAFDKSFLVFMAEDYGLCTHFKYHKHKILFFLAAMREYAHDLKKKKQPIVYYDIESKIFQKNYFVKLDECLKANPQIQDIHTYEINDHFFHEELSNWAKKKKKNLHFHGNPMFVTTRPEFKKYLDRSKRPFMMNFYMEQRRRLNLLVDDDKKPIGGKWSFDHENRKKYPKDIQFPDPIVFSQPESVNQLKLHVEKHFSKHPGHCEDFWLPVTRRQALHALDRFIQERLENFGPFEDAIHDTDALGFHSQLSMLMNSGLLLPSEVVNALMSQWQNSEAPLASVEGFVRQVIGWREFVKGIYDNYQKTMDSKNFWNNHRSLTGAWYQGETGLLPFDDSVKKLKRYGYAHHIERLMVQSNLMLLCEIHPKEVYKWFMEMYVDSADWVMAANVYGMGQMSEGGIFATKPYICGSNYILKMSPYKKEEWCETLDGLYWRFISKHREFFSENPRLSMMTRTLDKMKPERWNLIQKKAKQFLKTHAPKS